jgi:type I restriction enzyme S subunit
MSEWIEVPLSELVTFQKGRKVSTSAFQAEGYVTYLGASGIEGNGSEEFATTQFAVLAKNTDVLMLWDGERSGLVGFGKEGAVASTVCKLSPKGRIAPQYLYFFLCDKFEWIQNRRTGTGVPHVPKDIGRILRVRYPKDPNTQRKTATILASIDATIQKTEALIAKYQQIKAGLMHDLFTRGVLPDGQLRPPREQAPEMYQETEIGWLPKEWHVSGLANKGRAGTNWIRTGPFGSALKGEHWTAHGHPVITIGALGEGTFTSEELLFVNPKDANRLREFQLKLGDVVFSRVADVGRSVVIREEQVGWIMSSNLMRIAVDNNQARPDFLQLALAGDYRVKAQIRASVNSGGRDVANSAVLEQLRFAWPEPPEQDRIIALSNKVSLRIAAEQRKAKKLCLEKFGLMQDLLTGKVAVRCAEEDEAVETAA